MEPTLGAEPCIEDIFPDANLKELYERLVNTEHNYVEFLLHDEKDIVVTLVAFIDLDCFRVWGLRIKGCNEKQSIVLKLIAEPEASGGDIEKDCAEARIPAEPPYRVLQALKKLGLDKARPKAYRIIAMEEVLEIWPTED